MAGGRELLTRCRCRRLRARLVDYADGALDAGARARLEGHLGACPRCAADLNALRDIAAALSESRVPRRDEEFWLRQSEAIMRRVRRLPEREPAPRADRFSVWRFAAAAAAAVVVTVAAYELTRSPAREPRDLAARVEGLDAEAVLALADAVDDFFPQAGLLSAGAVAEEYAPSGVEDQPWVEPGGLSRPPEVSDLDYDELDSLGELVGDMLG